eukprot:767298-Hanusia_phi.AAC.1
MNGNYLSRLGRLHLVQPQPLECAERGKEHSHSARDHPPPSIASLEDLKPREPVGGDHSDLRVPSALLPNKTGTALKHLLDVLQPRRPLVDRRIVLEANPRNKAPVEEPLEDGGDVEPPGRIDQHKTVAPPQALHDVLHVFVLSELRLGVLLEVALPLLSGEEGAELTPANFVGHGVEIDPPDEVATGKESLFRRIGNGVGEGGPDWVGANNEYFLLQPWPPSERRRRHQGGDPIPCFDLLSILLPYSFSSSTSYSRTSSSIYLTTDLLPVSPSPLVLQLIILLPHRSFSPTTAGIL